MLLYVELMPPRRGPVDSLQARKGEVQPVRKFVHTCSPDATVGSLFEPLEKQCKDNYMKTDQEKRNFAIELLQTADGYDLTKDLVLGDCFSDLAVPRVIRILPFSIDRESSIPLNSALRPESLHKRALPFAAAWTAQGAKRQKLNELPPIPAFDPDKPVTSCEAAPAEGAVLGNHSVESRRRTKSRSSLQYDTPHNSAEPRQSRRKSRPVAEEPHGESQDLRASGERTAEARDHESNHILLNGSGARQVSAGVSSIVKTPKSSGNVKTNGFVKPQIPSRKIAQNRMPVFGSEDVNVGTIESEAQGPGSVRFRSPSLELGDSPEQHSKQPAAAAPYTSAALIQGLKAQRRANGYPTDLEQSPAPILSNTAPKPRKVSSKGSRLATAMTLDDSYQQHLDNAYDSDTRNERIAKMSKVKKRGRDAVQARAKTSAGGNAAPSTHTISTTSRAGVTHIPPSRSPSMPIARDQRSFEAELGPTRHASVRVVIHEQSQPHDLAFKSHAILKANGSGLATAPLASQQQPQNSSVHDPGLPPTSAKRVESQEARLAKGIDGTTTTISQDDPIVDSSIDGPAASTPLSGFPVSKGASAADASTRNAVVTKTPRGPNKGPSFLNPFANTSGLIKPKAVPKRKQPLSTSVTSDPGILRRSSSSAKSNKLMQLDFPMQYGGNVASDAVILSDSGKAVPFRRTQGEKTKATSSAGRRSSNALQAAKTAAAASVPTSLDENGREQAESSVWDIPATPPTVSIRSLADKPSSPAPSAPRPQVKADHATSHALSARDDLAAGAIDGQDDHESHEDDDDDDDEGDIRPPARLIHSHSPSPRKSSLAQYHGTSSNATQLLQPKSVGEVGRAGLAATNGIASSKLAAGPLKAPEKLDSVSSVEHDSKAHPHDETPPSASDAPDQLTTSPIRQAKGQRHGPKVTPPPSEPRLLNGHAKTNTVEVIANGTAVERINEHEQAHSPSSTESACSPPSKVATSAPTALERQKFPFSDGITAKYNPSKVTPHRATLQKSGSESSSLSSSSVSSHDSDPGSSSDDTAIRRARARRAAQIPDPTPAQEKETRSWLKNARSTLLSSFNVLLHPLSSEMVEDYRALEASQRSEAS